METRLSTMCLLCLLCLRWFKCFVYVFCRQHNIQHRMSRTFELSYDHFDFAAGFVYIPSNVLWYRAASPDVAELTDDCIYVGPKYVADWYAAGDEKRVKCVYTNTMPLKVLDIRFLAKMIPYILTHRKSGSTNEATMKWYRALCISLGSCSLKRQIELLHEIRTKPNSVFDNGLARMEDFLENADPRTDLTINPIEKEGVRVGITDIDYYVITIIRQLFSQIDGIISPMMQTPYHYQYGYKDTILPEMVVFYPKRVLKKLTATELAERGTPEQLTLQKIIHQTFGENGYLFDVVLGYDARVSNLQASQQDGGLVHIKEDVKIKQKKGNNKSDPVIDREEVLVKLKKGVKNVVKKYESAIKFAKNIGKDNVPRFLWKFMFPQQIGEMRGIDWNYASAVNLSADLKSGRVPGMENIRP